MALPRVILALFVVVLVFTFIEYSAAQCYPENFPCSPGGRYHCCAPHVCLLHRGIYVCRPES
uniref:Ptu1-like peptide pp13b n=1 Tax=Pristhesancus plagipennis TaxID=1955184 RepID=A0A1Q1NP85_PRIPG|nr:ptu1-like peptide pp13b [Pristhesancus plagipennis]